MPASDPFPPGSYVDDPLPASAAAWAGRVSRAAPRHLGAVRHREETNARTLPSTCAQFVLGADGTIQSYQISSNQYWYYRDIDLKGKSLRTLLCQLRPDWEPHLPFSLSESDTTLYLPEAVPGTTGVVLALHRLQHESLLFVSLTPELAPTDVLRESGMADFQPDPATFAKLFLRLRTVESRLDHYLSHFPGVVFHQRADLSFVYVGPNCASVLGLPAEALVRDSQTLVRMIHPADERVYYQELDRTAEATQPFSLVYRIVNPRSGAATYILDIRSPVRSRTGMLLGYEGVWLDITRQKIAEHRLTTRAWKENLSALTGGLLTDFSNVMTGIYSLSELYHNTLPPRHPLRDGLGLIKDNAAQAQVLVRKIIELNRETGGDRNYVNLGRAIRDQLDLIKIVLPRGTRLSGPAAQGEWPVYLDETAFRQTLVNLALNARDALKGAGEINIQLRRLGPGEEPLVDTIPALPPMPQPVVEMVFSDNGSGISPAHVARVFDPFFSTKEATRGAGLGLYNARLFVEAHGGRIAVRSSPGRGTEIVLLLPLADLSVAEPSGAPHDGAASGKRIRAVYLDQEATEDVPLAESLRVRGWEVHTVSTGDHTRRVLREKGVRLDVLIIRPKALEADLRLLLAEIRRDHPGLPIALVLPRRDPAELPTTLRSQVDLVLPAGIRDRDAVDSLATLLRLT